MKIKKTSKIALGLAAVVAAASVTGVCATWAYSTHGPGEVSTQFTFGLNAFYWEGSGEMEGGTGEQHSSLIEAIINGQYGLNTPNSYINNEISDRSSGWLQSDTLGSMDYWESANIANYFAEETKGLTFLLYFPNGSGRTYYLYTTNVVFGPQNTPNYAIGTTVYPIYRTTIEKNADGQYEATKSEIGYANSAYYDNVITGSWLVKYPSIDPESWKAGELGTGFGNAVNAYVGETTKIYPETPTTSVYYTFTNSTAGTRTITLNTEECTVNVYSANQGLVTAINGTAQGSTTVSWNASERTKYYFVMSGAKEISYTLS